MCLRTGDESSLVHLSARQDVMCVDEPLQLRGQRPARSERAGQQELVGRIESHRRATSDRAFHCGFAERCDGRG